MMAIIVTSVLLGVIYEIVQHVRKTQDDARVDSEEGKSPRLLFIELSKQN